MEQTEGGGRGGRSKLTARKFGPSGLYVFNWKTPAPSLNPGFHCTTNLLRVDF